MPRTYDELFPEDRLLEGASREQNDLSITIHPRDPEDEEPEPEERLYTGPPSDLQLREMVRQWDDDDRHAYRRKPWRSMTPEERRQARTDQAVQRREEALAENRARIAFIQSGQDLRQPPEHRGKVYEQPDQRNGIVIHTAFPPVKIGNPAEIHPDFEDFKAWGTEGRRETNPEYYCQGCMQVYASVVCKQPLGCGSARVAYPQDPTGTAYRCLACGRRWEQDRLCGRCFERLHPNEAAQQALLPGVKRKRPSKKSRQARIEFYE